MRTKQRQPPTRRDWYNHYVRRYEKHRRDDSLHMALWMWLLILEFGDTGQAPEGGE